MRRGLSHTLLMKHCIINDVVDIEHSELEHGLKDELGGMF